MDQLTVQLREKSLEEKIEILRIIEWGFSNMENEVAIVTISEISEEQTIDCVQSLYMDDETDELVLDTEDEEEYRFNPRTIVYIDIDVTF
jgi:hypothetical protein